MGLFSKKDYVCEKCGKTFSKRINLNGNLCDECYAVEAQQKAELHSAVRGYVNYRDAVYLPAYSSEEMRKIIEHREALLEKFTNEAGISRVALQEASDNYKQLSDEGAMQVLRGVACSSISSTMGAVYNSKFFVPTGYDAMIVDVEDVFAVAYTSDFKSPTDSKEEVILCVIFTNDPYVPVFPMIYVGKKGFFELTKSKKGRMAVAEEFTELCPNLKYPVMDIKQLKKQLKQDGVVRGNVDMKFMLDRMSDASVASGIFNSKYMYSDLRYESVQMLDRIGYIQDYEIDKILKMDKMFNRNFWKKHIDRFTM